MGTEDSGSNMRFQHRIGERILNCPSSGMDTNPLSDKVAGMAMDSGSMFKSSSGGGGGGADTFFGSGWDPLLSLTQNENFGGSSVVPHPHSEFGNSPYSVVVENQALPGSSHLVHFPPDSGLVEMVPKLPCFGSGSFSEMVGSFGLPDSAQIATPVYNKDGTEKASSSQGDQQISEEGTMGISPCGKRKKKASESNSPLNPNKNGEDGGEQQRDISGDEKKQKIEQNLSANSRGKQSGKQAKDDSNGGEAPKEAYIHVRARRGQATNSHSLAERVRRERISERMRLLQELVPGCNKITGKAVMLDEIINYVQSLQQQVEFLSMKLATVNPELNIDIDRILSKEILHSRGGGSALPGFGPGMSSSHSYPSGIPQGALPPGIPSAPAFHPLPQNVWDNELHSLLQMGFDPNSAISNLGPTGRSKLDL